MSWQNTFASGNWTDGFGATAGRSNPHRGTDLAVRTLYAWERLTVVNSDVFYSTLGYCVILRADDGELFGVAHCRKGTRANNGAVLKPGDKIANAATGASSQSNANFPGTQWTGIHFHITRTRGAAVFGASGLLDARPRILAAVSGGGKTPEMRGWEASDFGIGTNATKAQWKTIQEWLKKLGRYDGLVDGIPGKKTWQGIQKTLAKYGYYKGEIDGLPAYFTARGMQMYARDGGGYRGEVDGVLGPNSWIGFVRRLSS